MGGYTSTNTSAIKVRNVTTGSAWSNTASSVLGGGEQTLQIGCFGQGSSQVIIHKIFSNEFCSCSGGNETLEVVSSGGCSSSFSLPINLASFSVIQEKTNNLLLSWKTATEINNSHFNIEHSTDAHSFQNIGKINGAGNSTTEQNYDFTHQNPANGTNYYRLKQTDFDGNFTYSKVISVNINKDNQIQVFPNPTNGKLKISSPLLKKAEIEIFNAMGSLLKTIQWEGQEIDIVNLPSGVYYLAIHTEKGVVQMPIMKE